MLARRNSRWHCVRRHHHWNAYPNYYYQPYHFYGHRHHRHRFHRHHHRRDRDWNGPQERL